MKAYVLPLVLAGMLPVCTLNAQDKKITPEDQKKIAEKALKTAAIKDGTVVESAHIILGSGLPEAKAKTLVDYAEKVFALSQKALRFDKTPPDEPKHIIYLFGDIEAYRDYVRSVLKRSPDKDEFSATELKGEYPVIALTPKPGEKNPNYEAVVAEEITKLLISKKGLNARIDDWMKTGFHKVVMSKIDPKIGGDLKAKARTLAGKPVPKTAKVTSCIAEKAWAGPSPERDAVAMSLMEFFTFGAGGPQLDNLISGLKPSDEVREPDMMSALKGMTWKVDPKGKDFMGMEGLERAWRDWLSKGAPSTLK